MHLYYKVIKKVGVLNRVVDMENQRVIGLVKICQETNDHIYHWRTLLSWVNEFLNHDLRFKRNKTGTSL